MGNYKVCVYAICKNEEQFADRWMDSMSEADRVLVLEDGQIRRSFEGGEINAANIREALHDENEL